MDRRGHALQGMDQVYMHVTRQMHQHLCDVLEQLWYEPSPNGMNIDPCSRVPPAGSATAQSQDTWGRPLAILPCRCGRAGSMGVGGQSSFPSLPVIGDR